MKKFYNEPEMNISLFSQENVVTASGDVETVTAEALARETLDNQVTRTITLAW